jgi:hypothetical protein
VPRIATTTSRVRTLPLNQDTRRKGSTSGLVTSTRKRARWPTKWFSRPIGDATASGSPSSPAVEEVGERDSAERVGERDRNCPPQLGPADVFGGSAREIRQRRDLEHCLESAHGNDQPTDARTEVTPSLLGHEPRVADARRRRNVSDGPRRPVAVVGGLGPQRHAPRAEAGFDWSQRGAAPQARRAVGTTTAPS